MNSHIYIVCRWSYSLKHLYVQVKAVSRPLPHLPEDILSVNSAQKAQSNSEKNRPSDLSSDLSSKNTPEHQVKHWGLY